VVPIVISSTPTPIPPMLVFNVALVDPIRLKNDYKKVVWTHLTYKELDLIDADKCGILWSDSRASHICINFCRKKCVLEFKGVRYKRPILSET
jgi:hypothetical protein